MIFGLVQVLDAGLIDKRTHLAPPHLDRVAVVPFDHALDLFAVLEHKRHQRLAVDLLLKVERLRVRVLRGSVQSRVSRVNGSDCGKQRGVAAGRRTRREVWTNELARSRGADRSQRGWFVPIGFSLRLY